MRVIIKHNKCNINGDTAVLLVDMEEFKAMLDTIHPKVLGDYLSTRLKPKVQVDINNVQPQKETHEPR